MPSKRELGMVAAAVAAAGAVVAGAAAASGAAASGGPASGTYGGSGYGYGRPGGGPGGPGGPGGQHTTVTGAEAANVTAAVKAKDSAVMVQQVLKDADGSYDVVGTKAGNPVRVEVSKDLKTVTVQTGGFRGHGDRGTPAPVPSPSSSSSSST